MTRSIKALETHLETKLLNRSTRHISLTESGTDVFARAKRILEEVGQLEDSVSQQTQEPSGILKVNLPLSIATGIIAPNLPDFIAAYPKITVELDTTDRHIDMIQSGVDCIIRTGEITALDLVAKKVGAARTVMCAAPKYLEKAGTPTSVDELSTHTAVNYMSSLTHRPRPWILRKDGVALPPVEVPSAVLVTDAKALEAFAVSGLGITVTSAYAIQPLLDSGVLREIMADFRPEPRPIWALRSPGKSRLKVEVFITWLQQVCQTIPTLALPQKAT